jgi:hypothetical protein
MNLQHAKHANPKKKTHRMVKQEYEVRINDSRVRISPPVM